MAGFPETPPKLAFCGHPPPGVGLYIVPMARGLNTAAVGTSASSARHGAEWGLDEESQRPCGTLGGGVYCVCFLCLSRMFTTVLCGLPVTGLAFEFGGQLALGRPSYPPSGPYPQHTRTHRHKHTHTFIFLSSCQVCSVCVLGTE